jgi:CRISPR/Cas system CMR-associated protein Cmr5 small subunit
MNVLMIVGLLICAALCGGVIVYITRTTKMDKSRIEAFHYLSNALKPIDDFVNKGDFENALTRLSEVKKWLEENKSLTKGDKKMVESDLKLVTQFISFTKEMKDATDKLKPLQ